MRTFRIAFASIVCVSLLGCQAKTEVDAMNVKSTTSDVAESESSGGNSTDGEGLDIKLPGVDISIGKGKGVNVKAGGVDVTADENEGVQVTTPSTDLRVNEEEGLQLNAPQTNVRVSEEDGIDVRSPGVDIKSKP